MSSPPTATSASPRRRRVPVFASLIPYRGGWLRGDLVAGLTVWAVLVPESLAYASIAGVSPVVGLYAAIPALVLYAALGSSGQLIVGPMSATAALSASIVAVLAKGGTPQYVALTAALALVTGVLGILAGLCRLGFFASFISEPVMKGFIVGLALTIIAGQLPKLFGVEKGSGDFFEKIWDLIGKLGETNGWALGVGMISLAVVLALKRWVPLVPGSLVAVVLGIVAVNVFDLQAKGVAIVGHIDSGLPSIGLPAVARAHDYLDLSGPAVGVLLVGFAEGLGAAKTYAAKAGYDIDTNRELLGLGAANLGSGMCAGMVVNGSLSKTAVNGGAGARSQVSGLLVATLSVVTLLFLTGLFEKLPETTLAAVVIAAVIELVDIASLRRLYRVWSQQLGGIYGLAARADFIAAVSALLGVLIFDTLPGLFIGIFVSLLLLVYRASRPQVATLVRAADTPPPAPAVWVDVARHPDGRSEPGVLVVRVESGLFFANADHVRHAIRARLGPEDRVVVLDGETTPIIDVTATEMLAQLAHDLQRTGVTLMIARNIGQVRDVIGRETTDPILNQVYPSVADAIDAARSLPRSDRGKQPKQG